MSHPEAGIRKPISGIGLDSLPSRFQSALSCGGDKRDFRVLDLGSPVSPLRTQTAPGLSAPATSSSSSSSSVSGKTGSNAAVFGKRSDGGNHSGELSGSSEGSPTAGDCARPARNSRPGHRRSSSAGVPLLYSGAGSGGGSVSSPNGSFLPSGNICPSGKIGKMGIAYKSSARSDVLGSGTGNYGHGSVIRGTGVGKFGGEPSSAANAVGNIHSAGESVMVKKGMASSDFEEVKRAGNEQYKRGHFAEALCLYDRAISISPDNAACRSNRAAALMGLGRLVEAVRECEEAVKLDPGYGRAHQRLASLLLRLGQVENARKHLYSVHMPDPVDVQKLQVVERHLMRCLDARKIGDWKSALREGDAAIAAGADSAQQLFALRAEALLKLRQLEEADSALSNIPKFEMSTKTSSQSKFFGMNCDCYPFFVQSQVEMALGRFENAVVAAERASQIDAHNIEVTVLLNKVRSVAKARTCGNDLFNSGKFTEACAAYGEGLKFDASNPVLHCNRAACRFKLGQWDLSIDDCNEALRTHPRYTKALLRRAASYDKLGRWAESVRDYEVLAKQLPQDKEVAEALFHGQVALKKCRGEELSNMNFGGQVEEISSVEQFRAAISSSGVSVIHFKMASNYQCEQISPFFDLLCVRYPLVSFYKVDIKESMAVANVENVKVAPTFKIYKNGSRVKEMICPSQQVLELSVKNYSF